jgi:Tfp pilus assembly protein PilZ
MDERRKETREKMTVFTLVYDHHPRTLLGYLADLTLHGIMVSGEKPLEIDRRGVLAIEFPEHLVDVHPAQITVPARVVRCSVDASNPRSYNIGFEFTELTPENAQVIEAFLRRYHF